MKAHALSKAAFVKLVEQLADTKGGDTMAITRRRFLQVAAVGRV
jgi:hypothetical protein